ncbi:MAG: TniQ family protein [Maricaulaceae bacterium]
MTLPVKIQPLPSESFQSWIHRLSGPYLTSPDRMMTGYLGNIKNLRSLKNSELLKLLSRVSGIDTVSLISHFRDDIFLQEFFGVRLSTSNLWDTNLSIKHCCECWDADIKMGQARYFRKNWSEPWRVICPIHETYFSDHEFQKVRGGALYSHSTQSFFINKVTSKYLIKNQVSVVCQKFQEAYLDLLSSDPMNGLLDPAWAHLDEFTLTKYHLNIEGFISALEILLLNQHPIFKHTFMDWLSDQNAISSEIVFPKFERGSPKTIVSNLSTECKVFALNEVFPWFVKGNVTRLNVIKNLLDPLSPLRNSIQPFAHKISSADPYALIMASVAKTCGRRQFHF